MPNKPTFNAELAPQELEDLRRLAAQLGFILPTGQRAGDGSPRQLLRELAHAVRRHGLKHTAETLRPLFPPAE